MRAVQNFEACPVSPHGGIAPQLVVCSLTMTALTLFTGFFVSTQPRFHIIDTNLVGPCTSEAVAVRGLILAAMQWNCFYLDEVFEWRCDHPDGEAADPNQEGALQIVMRYYFEEKKSKLRWPVRAVFFVTIYHLLVLYFRGQAVAGYSQQHQR